MPIDMSQFFQVFFDEADELLAEMEKLLLAIDIAAPDSDDLNAIFRAAHSIKGGSGTFGLNDLTDITHVLESLLELIRKGEMPLTLEHVDAFLAAKDALKMQLDGHRFQAPVDLEAVANVRMMLHALSQNVITPSGKPLHEQVLARPPEKSLEKHPMYARVFRIALPPVTSRDVEALCAELGLLGYIEYVSASDISAVFLLATNESVDDIVAICSFIIDADDLRITEESIDSLSDKSIQSVSKTQKQIEDDQGYGLFEPMEFTQPSVNPEAELSDAEGQEQAASTLDKKSAKSAEKSHNSNETSSIRVGIEKVDQLINLVGELVITQAMIEQRTESLDPMLHERLLNSVSQLTRNTRDLQEAVMSIRMMPMDYVFSRFPRMVRDLAGKLGKKVEFVTQGAATELDKGLIERIIDPLTHLVRNSVDHGIETPEARSAVGKMETGRLLLSAGHQGGNIVIEVTDDGGGLNRERILAKAREKGLAVADTMSDSEVWQLIFAPGFSTAETVTDVSGRGVGMDVVKSNITAMGGVVDIRSGKGFGTTISISLPLTLAILDGMSIRVGDEVYILPLGYVIESLQPLAEDIKQISSQGSVVKVRNEYLPLMSMYQIFNITPRFTNPCDGILVILESEGKKAALLIDELVGQQQVVVKNIESNYRKVAGVSGATILGDGGVSLIIDVAALLRTSRPITDAVLHND